MEIIDTYKHGLSTLGHLISSWYTLSLVSVMVLSSGKTVTLTSVHSLRILHFVVDTDKQGRTVNNFTANCTLGNILTARSPGMWTEENN